MSASALQWNVPGETRELVMRARNRCTVYLGATVRLPRGGYAEVTGMFKKHGVWVAIVQNEHGKASRYRASELEVVT